MELFDWLFVDAYAKCGDARVAMIRAGYKGKHARRDGAAMLEKKEIRDELEKMNATIASKYNIDIDAIIQDIANVLTADPRDIVSIHRTNCRHCHGIDHRYQWTESEFNEQKAAESFGRPQKDTTGGIGFDEFADPHPDCPECGGLGVERVVIKDTRDLTPAQASLIQSVEQTKSGIKITMRSKDSARDAAARFLGMDKSTLNLNVGNKPLSEMTNDELLRLAQEQATK